MRFIFTITAALTLGLSILTACQNAAPPIKVTETAKTTDTTSANAPTANAPADEHGHTDDAPRISVEEAKKDFDAGKAVFVDTRAAASYTNEHIKDAINVPDADFEAKYKEIPTDKKIIAYCS